jgi:hypothetical protein
VIIRGRFVGDAPYFAVEVRSQNLRARVWLLADTGASRTTLLDRDVRTLRISAAALAPANVPVVGIGGSVSSYQLPAVSLSFAADAGAYVLQQDLWVVQHDFANLPAVEAARILRLPSVLGRDVLNQFHFSTDFRMKVVQPET